jgi:hypothetical protein
VPTSTGRSDGQGKRSGARPATLRLVAALSAAATLAALGAAIVVLIAAYARLATQHERFIALAMIGEGLLLLALILFALAFVSRRPRLASRPPLQFVRPMTVLGSARKDRHLTSADVDVSD